MSASKRYWESQSDKPSLTPSQKAALIAKVRQLKSKSHVAPTNS